MNAYTAHTFTLDTAVNVAGLTTLKGSAPAYTDHIIGGDHLTVESDIACASIDLMPTITTGTLVVGTTYSDLVTASDCTAYGYTHATAASIKRASARVRGYAGMTITRATSTVTHADAPYRLPERPVSSITSVLDADGATISSEDYTLTGGGFLRFTEPPGRVDVTYVHGYVTLPDELTELVCAIADRMAATPADMAAGAQSEGAGGESVTWGRDAYQGVADLTPPEKVALDRILGLKCPGVVEML